jgi:hypothetical protein
MTTNIAKTIAQRDAIPGSDRTIGDTCYVSDLGQTFILVGGTNDEDWAVVADSVFDDTITSGEVAGSGGTYTEEIDVVSIQECMLQLIHFSINSGTSADTTLEIYDDNPATTGDLIYQAANLDLPSNGDHINRIVYWASLVVKGSVWMKITNDGVGATYYNLRLRIKAENSEEFSAPPPV